MPADPKPDFDALVRAAEEEKERRAREMPTTDVALLVMVDAWHRLKELGWREAMYAPCDSSDLLLIEAGSTGVHDGRRDAERRFWLSDRNDVWPSSPILFKAAADAR